MDINELTLGQAKELKEMFGGCAVPSGGNLAARNIGKHVIVRSRNEGLNFGKLVAADETGCVISDARRIWYHKPADSSVSWYEGVATTGLHRDSKVSCETPEKTIMEDYSITVCTAECVNSFAGHKPHES